MNNELLSGTQLRFIEQSSQYEASFTELYCATPTTRKRGGKARTQERHPNRDNMSINAMQAAPFIEAYNVIIPDVKRAHTSFTCSSFTVSRLLLVHNEG